MYRNLIIYYFSGTGNAKAVSEWIANSFTKNAISCQIYEIRKSVTPDTSNVNDDTLVGFCYPTHGFNAPRIVLNFIAAFPKVAKARFFVLNTRAGMKLWKIFTPGLSGIALLLPSLILQFKGYRCAGMRPVDMPSNWISLHPGIRKKVTQSISDHCKRVTERFVQKLLKDKKDSRWIFELPLDLVITPISFLYYFIGRFMLAKTFFASYRCNSCELCIKQCPIKAIEMVDSRPYWKFTCESCMHCMNHCKERAIETAHGFTFLLWWLAFTFIPLCIVKLLIYFSIVNLQLTGYFGLAYMAIQIVVGFAIVFYGYKILHFLLRFRVINYLITYTSLTRLPFWRRYKYVSLKEKAEN